MTKSILILLTIISFSTFANVNPIVATSPSGVNENSVERSIEQSLEKKLSSTELDIDVMTEIEIIDDIDSEVLEEKEELEALNY